jgi:trehalose 6-phosphate phosphatase
MEDTKDTKDTRGFQEPTKEDVDIPDWVVERIKAAKQIQLFLDYDGTLADFAPTPDVVEPVPEVAVVLSGLARHPQFRITLLSGRRLNDICKLVPVQGVLLCGTYGIELLTPQGERVERVPLGAIRPALEKLKPQWERLIEGREGFFLEDKNWSLALHARFAEPKIAEEVLSALQNFAMELPADQGSGEGLPVDMWRVLGGDRFHEIGPSIAHKGKSVEYILEHYPWPDALLLYLGDDDKDEEAYQVIQERGGLAGLVSTFPRPTRADFRLESPAAARRWLGALPKLIGRL